MTIDALVRNLEQEIALMQLFVKERNKAQFGDCAPLLETISIAMFKAAYGLNMQNENILNPNSAAIDLVDDAKRVAVQVTANANSTKVKKTVQVFEAKDLKTKYDTLYVLGFCNATRKASSSACTVLDTTAIVSRIYSHADPIELGNLTKAFRRHQDYYRLHPYQDKECLQILIDVIDRSAVTHRMANEESITRMVDGLSEILELIGKGTISGLERSKSIAHFSDDSIKDYMRFVKSNISKILALVNEARRLSQSNLIILNHESEIKIDEIKRSIIEATNNIASNFKFNILITLK